MSAPSTPPVPARGLTQAEAARRLAEGGPNTLARERGRSTWVLLARQFASPLVWLLVAAAVLAGVAGEVADAVAVAAILLLNAGFGFAQEARADKALAALRQLAAPQARVLRDGHARQVPAADVVPGDVLLLEAGDVVAADARLLEAHALLTHEAALTGESTPVRKAAAPVPEGTPLAERTDTVFLGTHVSAGTAAAEVVATGMGTELGRIAHLLATAHEEQTPLQRRLAQVSRVLLLACVGIAAVVVGAGLARGEPWLGLVLAATALAVAAVPEGLPTVVTLALAVGVQRMARRRALVRELGAVETLGATTVLCTDKTGTLTVGQMEVREVWGGDARAVLEAAAACSDAELGPGAQGGTGDPTELALLRAAAAHGITREALERARPRVETWPFDSDARRMAVLREDGVLYVKGALEVVLPRCTRGTDGALEAEARMGEAGLRVLAVAVGRGREETDLTLLGLVGLADPPRPEAVDAVAAARRAGMRTVMITGDHPRTAAAIAREMGILAPGEDAAEQVHARVTAAEKLQLVRRLKARGEVVAMTGDGVNDAPALREAHIGVAMGRTGTEVTREAADLILLDDNYATLVAAVREGRGIFDNIRKALVYLLAGNTGELAVMLFASLLGWPLPLLPLQLLWVNLVTDGLPALALATDPVDADVLQRPPRRPDEPMLGRAQWGHILFAGALDAGATLLAFGVGLARFDEGTARSLGFSVLVGCELLRTFAARNPHRTLWQVGAFTNARLVGVVLLTAALQGLLLWVPALRHLFGLVPLSPLLLLLALALALVPVTVLELQKLVRQRLAA